jgi:hypothetical protein
VGTLISVSSTRWDCWAPFGFLVSELLCGSYLQSSKLGVIEPSSFAFLLSRITVPCCLWARVLGSSMPSVLQYLQYRSCCFTMAATRSLALF